MFVILTYLSLIVYIFSYVRFTSAKSATQVGLYERRQSLGYTAANHYTQSTVLFVMVVLNSGYIFFWTKVSDYGVLFLIYAVGVVVTWLTLFSLEI